MTLKKEVCEKCYSANNAVWSKSDDSCWKTRQDVLCPVDRFSHNDIKTTDNPPSWCKYSKEHAEIKEVKIVEEIIDPDDESDTIEEGKEQEQK